MKAVMQNISILIQRIQMPTANSFRRNEDLLHPVNESFQISAFACFSTNSTSYKLHECINLTKMRRNICMIFHFPPLTTFREQKQDTSHTYSLPSTHKLKKFLFAHIEIQKLEI